MSATENMKGLVAKYIKEENWIMLDCLNVWLHNESGATARSNFSELVFTGMMQDFYDNLGYNYPDDEIGKAINNFQADLRVIDIDLLYTDYYAMKRAIMPQIADSMVERILEKIVSEEQRRLVFVLAKYYETASNPTYGMLSSDVEKFLKSVRALYNAIFDDDLTLQHPEDYLRKSGLILRVDWVVSKRPESSKELVIAKWSEDFLKQIDTYVKVSVPKIVDRVEKYIQLLNQKDMIPQLVFYDLMLEKGTYSRTPLLKSEASIKDSMELLIPSSSDKIPFKLGICDRANGNLVLSPFVRSKMEHALGEVKINRLSSILGKIIKALKIYESEENMLFDVQLVSDSPRVWRIDGLASSLSIVVMPWCKPSDVQYVKDISQNTSATVVFAKEQRLPILKTLFGEDDRISFCFVTETTIVYTPSKNEIFQTFVGELAKDGMEVKCVSEQTETQYAGTECFSLPIDFQKFNERLLEVFKNSKRDIKIVSPYIDKTTFTSYISRVPKKVKVRIITSNTGEETSTRREWESLVRDGMMIYVKKLKLLSEAEEPQKKMEALHGRYLIVDDEFVVPSMPDLKLGASGLQKGELVEIMTSAEAIKIRQRDFEEYWGNPEEKLLLEISTLTWNPKTIKN